MSRQLRALAAVSLVAAACGAPGLEPAADDALFDGTDEREQALDFTCTSTLCSGAGLTWGASHRVGVTATNSAELLQLFRVPSSGTTQSLTLQLRKLRPFAGGVVELQAAIYEVTSADAPILDENAGPVAVGDPIDLTGSGAFGAIATPLSAATLTTDKLYGLRVRVTGLPATGEALIGVAALAASASTFTGTDFGTFRRGLRRANASVLFSNVTRFLNAGARDLAFGLTLGAAPSGLSCQATQPPSSWTNLATGLSGPIEIVAATDGTLYVLEQGAYRVTHLAANGTVLSSFAAAPELTPTTLSYSHGIGYDPVGFVYVADQFNDRIVKLDANLNYVADWSVNTPQDVAVAPDRSVVVLGQAELRRFTSEGTVVEAINLPDYARDVTVDGSGAVYLSMFSAPYVRKFDPVGNVLGSWGADGSGDGQFTTIPNLAIAPDGTVWATDFLGLRLQHFTSGGSFLGAVGSTESAAEGHFQYPYGITAKGLDLFVSDGDGRVHKLAWTCP